MNLDLDKLTYEQLLAQLRDHWLPSDTRARIEAELRSRDRCLANQYKQICGA